MRKLFQKNILTLDNKPKIKENLNNKNIFLRPKTAFKNQEIPIKLINKKYIKSKPLLHNTNISYGKSNININSNINYKSINGNFNSDDDDIFFSREENYTKQDQKILTSFTNTDPNISFKRAKTAYNKFRMKLENISTMFKNEPPSYFSSQKKLVFKHRGLIPGIPKDLLSRLKLIFKIFKNPKFLNYIEKAPSRRQNKIETITEYLWAYKKNHIHILDFYAIFYYYLCTNIQYDIKEINKNENNLNNIFKNVFANSLQFCKSHEFMFKKIY